MEYECNYSRTELYNIPIEHYPGQPKWEHPSALAECPDCGGIYRIYAKTNGTHFPKHSPDHTTQARARYRLVNGEWKWTETQKEK